MSRVYTVDEVANVMNEIPLPVAISTMEFRALTGLFGKGIEGRIRGKLFYRKRNITILGRSYKVVMNKALDDYIDMVDKISIEEKIRKAFFHAGEIVNELEQRLSITSFESMNTKLE